MLDLFLGILSLVYSIPSYFVKLFPNVRSQPRTYVYDGPFPDSPASVMSQGPDVLVPSLWALVSSSAKWTAWNGSSSSGSLAIPTVFWACGTTLSAGYSSSWIAGCSWLHIMIKFLWATMLYFNSLDKLWQSSAECRVGTKKMVSIPDLCCLIFPIIFSH